jgi:hypothetical protein
VAKKGRKARDGHHDQHHAEWFPVAIHGHPSFRSETTSSDPDLTVATVARWWCLDPPIGWAKRIHWVTSPLGEAACRSVIWL